MKYNNDDILFGNDSSEGAHGAIYLSEYLMGLNDGAGFLTNLSLEEQKTVRSRGSKFSVQKGQGLFFQGDLHKGVWVIEKGRVRSYYTGPSGREITLAYWTEGHFVGGPEIFGGGHHIWSGDALEDCELIFLAGQDMKNLVRDIPNVALGVIDGLVAKGKCYSALIQMLGTRSISERLEQLLVILADTQGNRSGHKVSIDRTITYEQIASIVGATRQWVTQSLEKLQRRGVLKISRKEIVIYNIEKLSDF
jgi:CRP/FNR family cyclic AMP-dependent transcriptional regulator